jgi:hypothetical protein
VNSSLLAQEILAMRFMLQIISARVEDAVVVCTENVRERRPRFLIRFDAHDTAIKNVKQGYPLSQLAFGEMTRKTQGVRYCKILVNTSVVRRRPRIL